MRLPSAASTFQRFYLPRRRIENTIGRLFVCQRELLVGIQLRRAEGPLSKNCRNRAETANRTSSEQEHIWQTGGEGCP